LIVGQASGAPFIIMRPKSFRNPWAHDEHGFSDILRWKLGLPPLEKPLFPDAPDTPAARSPLNPQHIATPPTEGWRISWLGHASFLLQGAGVSLLVDPVFSNHCTPLPLPSLRRLSPPPCGLQDLPQIHAVLLTHSHYDHLDLPTLRRLGRHLPLYVPEGHAEWLRRKGFKEVTEIPWFETRQITTGLNLTATPAQHFSARSLWDKNLAHWCGWLLDGASCKLWHAGDSGYCEVFREIVERFGPIDFGMIPIGAYQPRHIMRSMHLNPEEAAQVFLETRCRRAVAMHWGTFRLTDEPLGEPPLRLASALEKHGIATDDFIIGAIGQSWHIQPVAAACDHR
jgi:N-acyl-phosphatidylethanolamine-hydrolysing phospholipase D